MNNAFNADSDCSSDHVLLSYAVLLMTNLYFCATDSGVGNWDGSDGNDGSVGSVGNFSDKRGELWSSDSHSLSANLY